MKYHCIYDFCLALCETRLGATVFGRLDNWVLTAILGGVAGKIAFFTTGFLLHCLAWHFFRLDSTAGFSGSRNSLSIEVVFVALILGPILESALVLFTVWLLSKKMKANSITTVVMSGAVHVPLHGLSILSLSVFPMFALHAIIQMNWMERGKALGGYRVIIAAHAITNAIAIVVMALP